MKKFAKIIAVALVLLLPVSAMAVTFQAGTCLKVWGEPQNGVVHFESTPEVIDEITSRTQFCPDRWRETCGFNWVAPTKRISPNHAVTQLDMEAVRLNQRAFNTRNSDSLWLLIPHVFVLVGENLILEDSWPSPKIPESGGAHFTYIGDLPPGSYVPLHPVPQGGGACGAVQTAKAAETYQGPVATIDTPKEEKVAVVATSPQGKKKCDTCAMLGAIKSDTEDIIDAVGEATLEEKAAGLETVHKKETKILEVVTENQKNIGTPKDPDRPLTKIVEDLESAVGKPENPKKPLFKTAEESNKKIGLILVGLVLLLALCGLILYLILKGRKEAEEQRTREARAAAEAAQAAEDEARAPGDAARGPEEERRQ